MTYRKTQISRIKYFSISDSFRILKLDRDMPINLLATLYNKFGLNKKDIDGFAGNNKNAGVFLDLRKKDTGFSDNWEQFIDLVIPKKKHMTKSDNIIVSKDYNKLLLITERKILSEDLKNLNNLIFKINKLIKGDRK